MKTHRLAPSLLGVALIGVALGCDKSSPPSAPTAPQAARSSPNFSRTSGGEQTFRWDILTPDATITPGGTLSALASDNSMITLTGHGTFKLGDEHDVTGGGMWQIFAPGASSPSANGTYAVTALVSFDLAPGNASGAPDLIGNGADARAGLLILEIRYSDGSRGIFVESCSLVGPANVLEGVTASKGNVDFWQSVVAPQTIFHVLNEEAD